MSLLRQYAAFEEAGGEPFVFGAALPGSDGGGECVYIYIYIYIYIYTCIYSVYVYILLLMIIIMMMIMIIMIIIIIGETADARAALAAFAETGASPLALGASDDKAYTRSP